MATTLKKTTATIAGVPVAGDLSVNWKLMVGVTPYQTILEVHESDWYAVESQMGQPTTLKVTDARGVTVNFRKVYPLEERATRNRYTRAFVLSDVRWLWPYKFICRDFNIPRRTGDITYAPGQDSYIPTPIETAVTRDEYRYNRPSIKPDGTRWKAKEAVREVLQLLTDPGTGSADFEIHSFPIEGDGEDGQFSLHGVEIRDQADAAIQRLLSYVPGADLYITPGGRVRVFDAADLDAADKHLEDLKTLGLNRTGAVPRLVDRMFTRPGKAIVYYQRELECLVEFEDDYSGQTQSQPDRTKPFVDNVIPTVDVETIIEGEYDPETNRPETKTVAAGVYVKADRWLAAIEKATKEAGTKGSLPWNFNAIKRHWLQDLSGVLAGSGSRGVHDLDPAANIALRVQALLKHLRQTFRMNRRFSERVREFKAVRSAMMDPVSGQRAAASVWGEITVVPTVKGQRMLKRDDPQRRGIYRQLSFLPKLGERVLTTEAGPALVNFLDKDIGVFRVDYLPDPAGLRGRIVPCHLEAENNNVIGTVVADPAQQDEMPMGQGMKMAGKNNSIFLKDSMEMKAMFTIVPNAPNNKKQFHREIVDASKVDEVFAREFRVKGGKGPDFEIFVPPNEASARFAWTTDSVARDTIGRILGLDSDDPNEAGIEDRELPGFTLVNEQSELYGHAIAAATEALAAFADSSMGTANTILPKDGKLELVGNMTSKTVQISSAPSARVDVATEFPGRQRPINKWAIAGATVRRMLLGVLPFGKSEK